MARSRASGPLKIAISELPSWSIFSTRQSPVCTRSRCDDESARSAVQIGSIRPALSQYARCARDSPLQEDGFELSLKIQPKENCGFSGLAISGIVPQTGVK